MNFKYISKIVLKREKAIKDKLCRLINKLKKDKSKKNVLYTGLINEKDISLTNLKRLYPKEIWKDFYLSLGFKNEEDYIYKYLNYLVKNKKYLISTFDIKLMSFFGE